MHDFHSVFKANHKLINFDVVVNSDSVKVGLKSDNVMLYSNMLVPKIHYGVNYVCVSN